MPWKSLQRRKDKNKEVNGRGVTTSYNQSQNIWD